MSAYAASGSYAFSDSSTCDDADASSLLQARKLLRVQRTQTEDANYLLRSMRDVANSFTEGSAVTMTPADVNAAIGTANTALQTMFPLFQEQHALAQREIGHAMAAVQACHDEHGGDVRARLEQAVATAVVAKDNCEGTLADAIEAEHEACAGQGENPNCLCDEARTAITDQTALCAAVTDTYEAIFCEHQVACSSFQQCHAQEMDMYTAVRADIEAAMTSRQEEYRTFMQVDCLMNLITTAMLSGTPINHASLVACDDVNVDHLSINFPQPPAAPADCPRPQSGNPQCVDQVETQWCRDGSLDGAACCAASCGSCGGAGCGGRPGGADQCCHGRITAQNRVCEDAADVACVVSNGQLTSGPPVLAGYEAGNVGACRTADGDGGSGMYSRADNVDNVAQCASECDASATCLAFEFGGVTTGNTGCELHRQRMPAATGHSNGLCYNLLDSPVAEAPHWSLASRHVGKYLAGHAAGDFTIRTVSAAAARCDELGNACGGITCRSEDSCTVRAGTDLLNARRVLEFSLMAGARYVRLAYGAAGCEAGKVITTQQECTEAHLALNFPIDPVWTGSSGSIPDHCSVREPTAQGGHHLHFNSNPGPGVSRVDLAPVCKA